MSEQVIHDKSGIEKYRMPFAYLLLGSFLFIALFSEHSWSDESWLDAFCDWMAYGLIISGVIGRLWALIYIGGKKNKSLIVDGPYSLCRNPLYLFTFIMSVGIVFAFEILLLFVPLMIYTFSIYYLKVTKEEAKLQRMFGQPYLDYSERIGRVIPSLRHFSAGTELAVSPKNVIRGFLQMLPVILLLPIIEIIEHLHRAGILPTLFRIP